MIVPILCVSSIMCLNKGAENQSCLILILCLCKLCFNLEINHFSFRSDKFANWRKTILHIKTRSLC